MAKEYKDRGIMKWAPFDSVYDTDELANNTNKSLEEKSNKEQNRDEE